MEDGRGFKIGDLYIYSRLEQSIQEGDAWGENDENDYYNDNPSARPPSPPRRVPSEYATPPSNLPVSIQQVLNFKKRKRYLV